MKFLIFLSTLFVILGSFSLNAAEEYTRRKCHCVNCQCTIDNHCGCYNGSCTCDGKQRCSINERDDDEGGCCGRPRR